MLCGILVALMLLACLALRSSAQVGTAKTPQATKPAGTSVVDPLGRTTPMGSVMGLLKYEERGDFATAARYLKATADAQTDLVRSAEQLHALGPRFKGNVSLLSDNPEGTIGAGLLPGHVRAGVIAVGDMPQK